MKRFFENYGFLAISAIVIALLIGMLTPVGFYIKNGVMALTGKFGDTTNGLVNGIDVNPYGQKEEEGIDDGYYITFSSPGSFTVSFIGKNWDGAVEYSTDAVNWTVYDTPYAKINSGSNNKLYFRGRGNSVIQTQLFFDGSNISCSGNMETMLDHQTVANGGHPVMGYQAFREMFFECSHLVSAPELPATTLAEECYARMFFKCTSLTAAPALPATTLADYCYDSMFYGCTGLTSAPALPATTLADYCYDHMFSGCTNLTAAPALPATTLADYCYDGMFQGCTSLTSAPALPATTLAYGCYEYMFNGCTSLTATPKLPATTLTTCCYSHMFAGCTSLTALPDLSAVVDLSDDVYYSCEFMFDGCTNIKLSETQTDEYTIPYKIPYSGDGESLMGMFNNTGGTFTATPEANTYYLHNSNSIVE